MFCTKCGTQISDDSMFCYKCGAPTHLAKQKDSIEDNNYNRPEPAVTPATNNHTPQAQPQTTTADEGIYGLLGFVFAFLIPILGLIFSIIGMGQKKNNGLAAAGLMISVIIILLAVVIAIAVGIRYGFS
ncbi:MAG: zinc-ribbon domain-containing protein [Clostridiales bacterium]|nr:zinc-ribbon domain-containing protein [Clostridiales bacterium]